MCYAFDAAPPLHGRAVTAAASESLVLTAADGARFAAHLAVPERPSGMGVLVLPDNNGLSHFYETLTVRLAEQGHTALAIDYFGRTAGPDHRSRDEGFREMGQLIRHLVQLTPAGLDADMAAAAEHLRSSGARQVVSLGFCFGGRQAFRTAAPEFGTAGAVGFYGFPDAVNGSPGPTQLASELTAPILAFWGGADEAIPQTAVEAFDGALAEAGCPREFVTYEGAPHGFFEQGAHEFAEASADAWRRVLDFIAPRP
ncbi:dienelactone hydrolase family protein [Streptomyces sp. NPDC006544]|uniref:dienelactone hydrolase family protein n=1 Tax=Streptomyces sp. NPDC006544 TaxID=3154583 RepID=UPI00339EA247